MNIFSNFLVGVSDDDSESSSSRSELVRFRVILVEIVEVAFVVVADFFSKLSVVLETSLSWSGSSSEFEDVDEVVFMDFLAGNGIIGSAVVVSSSSSSSLMIMRKSGEKGCNFWNVGKVPLDFERNKKYIILC